MANPQLEDGYTKIANEILEALSQINLYPYEWRVLLFIIRKTYGWQRKSDLIPLSQIVLGTGILKGHVSRTLKALLSKGIVTRLGNKQIGFNKDYTKWQLQKLPVEVTRVTRLGNKKLPAQEPQKKRKKLSQKKEEFLLYMQDMKLRFPLVDFNAEFEKYLLWWKHKNCKNTALALLNWMTRAEKFRTEREYGNDEPQPLR